MNSSSVNQQEILSIAETIFDGKSSAEDGQEVLSIDETVFNAKSLAEEQPREHSDVQ